VIAARGGACDATDMLQPGDPAPDFTATTHDGRRVTLGDFRGRKVLLWFYPKADTPG
jgi:peroxiredoxin Q/BCP